jgi:hypothetical protein
MVWDLGLSSVPGDDNTRKKEHGSAVLAAPITRRKLEVLEELETILDGVEGSIGRRKIWQTLYNA